jgi:hypothetical protein
MMGAHHQRDNSLDQSGHNKQGEHKFEPF